MARCVQSKIEDAVDIKLSSFAHAYQFVCDLATVDEEMCLDERDVFVEGVKTYVEQLIEYCSGSIKATKRRSNDESARLQTEEAYRILARAKDICDRGFEGVLENTSVELLTCRAKILLLFSDYFRRRGMTHSALRALEEAFEGEELLSEDHRSVTLLVNYGGLLCSTKQYRLSLQHTVAAIRLIRKRRKAIEAQKEAEELEEDQVDASGGLSTTPPFAVTDLHVLCHALHNAATCCEGMGHSDAAIRYYESAVSEAKLSFGDSSSITRTIAKNYGHFKTYLRHSGKNTRLPLSTAATASPTSSLVATLAHGQGKGGETTPRVTTPRRPVVPLSPYTPRISLSTLLSTSETPRGTGTPKTPASPSLSKLGQSPLATMQSPRASSLSKGKRPSTGGTFRLKQAASSEEKKHRRASSGGKKSERTPFNSTSTSNSNSTNIDYATASKSLLTQAERDLLARVEKEKRALKEEEERIEKRASQVEKEHEALLRENERR
jgi:hypothetical protein